MFQESQRVTMDLPIKNCNKLQVSRVEQFSDKWQLLQGPSERSEPAKHIENHSTEQQKLHSLHFYSFCYFFKSLWEMWHTIK